VPVLTWAACLGLVAGTVQMLAFLVKYTYFDPRNLNVSRHFPWMYPVSGLIVVATVGCGLAILGALAPRWISVQVTLGALFFLAFLTFLFVLPIHTAVCLLLAAGLSLQTTRQVVPRLDSSRRWVWRGLVGMVGLLVVVVAVCFGREAWAARAARAADARPAGTENVLLIVLDTVRADRLSVYGHDRKTTPNLERFAARGVRFDKAYATAPWTAPSHASMFTGCWSHELSVGWERPLDRTKPTLSEYLGGRGRATGGFVANAAYCGEETGLSRGFAHYEDYDVTLGSILMCSSLVERTLNFVNKIPALAARLPEDGLLGSSRKSAARIRRDFLDWQSRLGGQPFFAFLNFYDAHHPYIPPEPPGAPFGRLPASSADYWMLKRWWSLDKRHLVPPKVELARDSYDQCLAYLDREIGRLLDDLESRDLLRKTLVIITADHGEHFGEHHLFGHGCSLYTQELHVPLLVLDPSEAAHGMTVSEPVSLRDVAATVVERLGVAAGSPFPGRSLAHFWSTDASSSASEPVLSALETAPGEDPNQGESPGCRGAMRSVVAWGCHYIVGGDSREELFDLENDRSETRDLANDKKYVDVLKRFRGIASRPEASAAANRVAAARANR
jgi:arylsulfatase A-like enzyme